MASLLLCFVLDNRKCHVSLPLDHLDNECLNPDRSHYWIWHSHIWISKDQLSKSLRNKLQIIYVLSATLSSTRRTSRQNLIFWASISRATGFCGSHWWNIWGISFGCKCYFCRIQWISFWLRLRSGRSVSNCTWTTWKSSSIWSGLTTVIKLLHFKSNFDTMLSHNFIRTLTNVVASRKYKNNSIPNLQ